MIFSAVVQETCQEGCRFGGVQTGNRVREEDGVTIDMVVDRFFEAVERGDWGTLDALYADDLSVWHNFSDEVQTKEENIASLRRSRAVAAWNYVVAERIVIGDRVIQRHAARIQIEGHPELLCHAVLFITVREGQIAHIDEYLDTAAIQPIRARTPNN